MDLSEIQTKLVPWLKKKMPQAQDLALTDMRVAERGFSTDTFLFNVSWHEGGRFLSEGMVIRRQPELPLFPDYDLRRQFFVMERLEDTIIPVPKVYWLERDQSVIGDCFYIMGEEKGITVSDFPVYHAHGIYLDATPEQRAKMWWGCVETIAAIHALDWKRLGLSFLAAPRYGPEPLDQVLNYYGSCLDWAKEGPQPILETTLDWLRRNKYTPEHLTFCWGDSRMSNILYGPDFEIKAVLDWETAYLGDHEADLGWMLFLDWANSEGTGIRRLEGTPSREETVERYEALTGWKVKNLLYNEVLAAFLLSVPMLTVYKRLRKIDLLPLGEDVEQNNFCTQRLAELLNLDAPGPRQEMTSPEE